jgi:geranylgeranyl reductase family protein
VPSFDAIIVGAGPSGCAAAYDLAAAGRSVLLLDRHAFPRRKPCAGALTLKTVHALRFSIEPAVRTIANGIRVSRDLSEDVELRSQRPICLMTVRSELDEFCLNRTIEAGARFQLIDDVIALEELADHVTVRTPQTAYQASFVIGADGANSKVRLLLGEQKWFRRALAIEAHAPVHERAKPLELEFGVVPRGYGWSFHKGDHLNVGLYTEAPGIKLTRGSLAAYLKRKFLREDFDHFVGHYLGVGGLQYTSRHPRIFLVGDAAGMTDPLSGEGICNAIKSGQAAAEAILNHSDTAHAAYEQNLEEIRNDLAFCERATGKFYGHLREGFAALRVPGLKRALMNGYAQGLTLSAIRKSVFTLPFSTAFKS